LVTLEEVQKHTKETYKEQHDLSQLAIALGGESGEYLNLVKKIKRAEHDPKFTKANGNTIGDLKKKAGLELIDILYYLSESANELKLDLSLLWLIKIDLNAVKYSRKEKLDPLTEDWLKLEND
jgi:hypothetical protein